MRSPEHTDYQLTDDPSGLWLTVRGGDACLDRRIDVQELHRALGEYLAETKCAHCDGAGVLDDLIDRQAPCPDCRPDVALLTAQSAMAPEGWREFIEECAQAYGGMVNGNTLSAKAALLLAAAPAQPAAQEVIDKPARIGATLFRPGVSVRTVIERAYRQYEYVESNLGGIPAAAQDQGEVQSRERWTVMCGHWQDTTLAIHGERIGHIASGIDEEAAHAIVNAHNQGLPPIATASTGQEVKP